jgi:hypothetical protein
MDVSNRGVTTRQDNQRSRMTCDNRSTREEHINLVLLNSILILDGPGILGYTLALSSQDRLVDVEAIARDGQNPAVSGYSVTNCNRNDISRNQLISLDAFDMSVAYDFRFVG